MDNVRLKNYFVIHDIVLKTIEDLREVKDQQLISGAFALGIIPAEAHFFLEQCRELRNNFSTAQSIR